MAKQRKTSWQSFMKKHRRRGLSMKQVGRLWRKSGKKSSTGSKRRSSGASKQIVNIRELDRLIKKLQAAKKLGKRGGKRRKKGKKGGGGGGMFGGFDFGKVAAHHEAEEAAKWNDPGYRWDKKKGKKGKGKKSGKKGGKRKGGKRKLTGYARFSKAYWSKHRKALLRLTFRQRAKHISKAYWKSKGGRPRGSRRDDW